MKILVTGAAGFIGSHACERLLAGGHSVVGVDCFDGAYSKKRKRRNIKACQENPNFKLVEGDYGDRLSMTQVLKADACDAVLHLAGQPDLRLSVYDPVKYERGNVGNLIPFFEALRECGPRNIVLASSSAVYGPEHRTPWREDMLCMSSLTPYGASLRAAEIFLSTYAGLYGFKGIVLRIFTVYGPRQRPDMAAASFARGLLSGEAIPIYGGAPTSRDLTYVSDIVSGIEAALLSGFKQDYAVYNLGSGTAVETLALLKTLEEMTGKKATLDHQQALGEMPLTLADISKARAELGYEPKVSLREGLEQLLDWTRADLVAEPPEAKK
ncbi:MAG TPA: NAD-dependent epimerase/dehydratase family protein [Planctomycetota bacterium]|nr:NAD-dependent epimerase/dehydratase family protein [Planctomycetota bacterium]